MVDWSGWKNMKVALGLTIRKEAGTSRAYTLFTVMS